MKAIKIAGNVIAMILVFVAGFFAEDYFRSLKRKPIPIIFESDPTTTRVTAYVQPDFLWNGEAWWIEVESHTPVAIELDGEWNAVIPPGTHTIFSNHDEDNTATFSSNRLWKTPSRIVVK